MVLLKNEGGVLPFPAGTRTAIFGKGQIDYVRGGGGSGDVTTSYTRSIYEGMKQKEAEGRIQIFDPLSAFYEEEVRRQYAAGAEVGKTVEPAVPEKLLAAARRFADTAVIVISRYSSEGWDRKGIPGWLRCLMWEAWWIPPGLRMSRPSSRYFLPGRPGSKADSPWRTSCAARPILPAS